MKKLWPIIFILLVTCVTFYKVFTKAEYPYPGDLLVSFNFPWYSGGWEGYNPWTTHKEFVAMDAIRQHLPWHQLTFSVFKEHMGIPLWNPYSFSGTPHLGNIQSYIFNPLNFLFVFLPMFPAWVIFIILQVPFTISFTYLFGRSLKLSKPSSILGGISFLFSSYYLNWLEIGIVGYSILWLPLILFSVQRIFESPKIKFIVLLIFASCATIFAGHIQTAVFVFLVATSFYTFKLITLANKKQRTKFTKLFAFWGIFTFLFTALQTIPALETYLNSPLTEPLAKRAFDTNSVPFFNFISLFAQDFFGNPSVGNFWSVIYGDGTPYIGSVALFFSVYGIFVSRRKEIKFFAVWALFIFLYTTRSPLYFIIQKLQVPFLTGTTPAREMFVLCFALSILAAIGMDEFIAKKKNYFKNVLFGVFITVYIVLFIATVLVPKLANNTDLGNNLLVTRRNLIIPTFVFLSLPASYFFGQIAIRLKVFALKDIWIPIILVLTVIAGSYQFNKSSPSSPKAYFYPTHPVFTWLKENAGIDRFQGEETAKTWNNISAFFEIYSAEGYQVFRDRRYAELFASQETGKIPNYYERSVAEFTDGNIDNKKRLYSLTGVKYLLSKDDSGNINDDQNHNKPNDFVKLRWQTGKFKVYERLDTLPRYWLSTDYLVTNNDQEILDKIYDSSHDLKTLLLEKKPELQIVKGEPGSAELIRYEPDSIIFNIDNQINSLFFISDTYNNGWKAYIDGKETKILRAHYVFRAVEIPKNTQVLQFKYDPLTFKIGIGLTILGIILIFPSLFYVRKKIIA